jgi:MFS transporter, DHA2 family, multidrug resistance protein
VTAPLRSRQTVPALRRSQPRDLAPDGPDRRRWWILAVLCLSVLLVVVDNTIVNVALPTISRDLSASTQDLQWVVDAYSLVFAGLLLVGGNLGDRLGRRRVLQAGLALFALTSLGAALARGTGELIGARAAMGVAAALIYPATLALLTSVFTNARERAMAIGIWSGVSGLAVAVGPVCGGLLLRHFAWSSVFYVNIPIVIVAVAAGRVLLPEARDRRAGRFDPLGALLSVSGIGLLTWGIIEAPEHGWASAATIGSLAGALAILAVFTWWQARRPDPMLDMRLFRNPRFTAASGAIALAFFGLFGFIFMITQYFQVVRGYDPLRAGVATLPFAIVTGAVSPAAIILMKRLGTKVIVTAGLALISTGFLVASGTTADSAYWGRLIVSMALMAAGLGLTTSPATEAIMGALPRDKAGAGSAVNDTTREIGGTLGVAVIGSVPRPLRCPPPGSRLPPAPALPGACRRGSGTRPWPRSARRSPAACTTGHWWPPGRLASPPLWPWSFFRPGPAVTRHELPAHRAARSVCHLPREADRHGHERAR